MRHIAALLVVSVSLAGLSGCASKVQVDSLSDPGFDFGSYHTFFWAQPKEGVDVSSLGLQEPRVIRSVSSPGGSSGRRTAVRTSGSTTC
jgi:hypothetical protein